MSFVLIKKEKKVWGHIYTRLRKEDRVTDMIRIEWKSIRRQATTNNPVPPNPFTRNGQENIGCSLAGSGRRQ